MPLYYFFSMEELEPRSFGEAAILVLFRLLLAAMLAALIGSLLLLWAMVHDERRDAAARVVAAVTAITKTRYRVGYEFKLAWL